MDIGTAKPSPQEMRGVPHHMLDIASPDENFSVADFTAMARPIIAKIYARGRLPIVAGGTGLYVDSLVYNIAFSAGAPRDDGLRARLREKNEKEGGQALLAELAALDPECAAGLHPNNTGRIIRAIEVCTLTGVTMTETQRRSRERQPLYRCCRIGLGFADRAKLYSRIDRRVDSMLAAGLESEAKGLLSRFGGRGLTSMQAIGYKEFGPYFAGEVTLEETAELIKRETRRYAKRQLTWFRKNTDTVWLEASDRYEIICEHMFAVIDKSGLL
jgi:tRNA dimethylallyltransferase